MMGDEADFRFSSAGRPFHLDRHLDRLRASADMMGIVIPVRDEALAGDLDRLLEAAANPADIRTAEKLVDRKQQ